MTGRLRYDGLDYHTVSHIAEDLESHYLQRWADAIRGANPPKLERTARSIAAYLLDLGFGPNYLHRWWTYRISHEATAYSLADVVEQAHTLRAATDTSLPGTLCIPVLTTIQGRLPARLADARASERMASRKQLRPGRSRH